MDRPTEQIKERLSIDEVISSYIKLEKSGINFKARCPFHNEKTPSFFVSKERNSFYCFGCGAKGDIFSFVEQFEGLDFKGALKLLAEKAGVQIGQFKKEENTEKDRMFQIMEEATLFFINNLSSFSEVSSYLKERGLEENTIKDFRLGFAPLGWDNLYNFLRSKGYKDTDIENAGLIKKKDKGFYDRFRSRIIFPIMDSSGRVIAFSGRIFFIDPKQDDGKSAKYLNSPETLIFNKSSVLFGIDKAKDAIRKNNFSILVEGQIDLLLSHQVGFKNTVASSGTAMTDSLISKEDIVNNLGLIIRLSRNIVLAYDSDRAGINATNRFASIALSLGMDVKVADIKEGMDPADLISKMGTDAWRNAIRNSKHFVEFLLLKILEDTKTDMRKTGILIKEKLLPYINEISSSIERSYFIKLISDKSGISETALIEDLKKVELELKYEKEDTKQVIENREQRLRKDPIERRLLGIALWQDSLEEKSIDPQIIFQKLSGVIDKYKDIKEDLIYEVEEFYSNSQDLKKDVDEMMLSLEEEYLNEELSKYMLLLQKQKGTDEEMNIFKKINDISKRKEEIKNGRLINKK